ncbi:MAG: after-VIT domain-containing protein [Leptolyngbyaceae cyanobacterium SM1_3_5]|nr:after-VIT domain-containing protein [Leptolyngbyaceae cyanobacterium SM1_3_5]
MTLALEQITPGLYVESPEGQLAFPLQHTEVQAKIAGNLSRVEVVQTFENPFATALEAVYIFPLPDESAVDEMEIRMGDRTIKGSIKKRQEAQQIYQQAKQAGRTAGLLEQERDNVFTQSIANILPGERIDVTIRYTDSLKFAGGSYEFVFPTVVGPRYIPGTAIEGESISGGSAMAPLTRNQDTDRVPDASRLNAPILPAGMRSGHDIGVTIEIVAGLPIREVSSPSHAIQIDRQAQRVRVRLSNEDTIPNKDLIVRYQIAAEHTQSTVLAQQDQRGGHFAAYLIPAIEYRAEQIVPKDVVFLIDTSGSQAGAPLMQCQALMRQFIHGLNPDDTFSIVDFSNTTRQLAPVPLANTAANRSQAIGYIDRLSANGGTEMLRGIQAVLNFPIVEPGRVRSIVLLTDGYIGNEVEILATVQRQLQPGNRLHSFGAGSSVNRFLLNRIAEIGGGTSRIIRTDEPADQVVEAFFRQINHPVLTNIQLRWEGSGEAPAIYPATPPDLFVEQPLVLLGRKGDAISGRLHITGTAASGDRYRQSFDLHFDSAGNPAVAQLWGRARIKQLTNQMVGGDTKAGVEAVTDTALAYQLLSQYTAFVAVSDDVRSNLDPQFVSVQVPVEMPEAVSHLGIYGGMAAAAPSMRMQRPEAPRSQTSLQDLARSPAFLSPPPTASAPSRAIPPSESIRSRSIDRPARRARELPIQPSIQIVSATGLDERTIDLLRDYLLAVQVPTGFSGQVVFEFQVKDRRLIQLVLDEQASTLTEAIVIDALRRSLLAWRASATADTVRLVLQIQS